MSRWVKRRDDTLSGHVCFTPKADICGALARVLAQKRTFRDSLDQLVGALLEVNRYVESERPGCWQVDDKLEFRRLQDRQVSRLSALEDLTGVGADLMVHANTIGIVAHQPAGFD